MNRLTRLRKPVDHLHIEVSQRMATVHDHHQPHQRLAAGKIRCQQSVPLRTDFFRRLGKTVAGQIDEELPFGEREIVEVLGTPGRL